MNELHNYISITKNSRVVLHHDRGNISDNAVLGLLADISQLGFTLDGESISVLKTQTDENFKNFHKAVVNTIKYMVGDHVTYSPLYRNFPDHTPEHDEYLIKRIVGFLCNIYGVQETDFQVLSCGHAIDGMVNFIGYSLMAEYADRDASDPIAKNSDGSETGDIVQVGKGINIQSGYLFKNNWEIFQPRGMIPEEQMCN